MYQLRSEEVIKREIKIRCTWRMHQVGRGNPGQCRGGVGVSAFHGDGKISPLRFMYMRLWNQENNTPIRIDMASLPELSSILSSPLILCFAIQTRRPMVLQQCTGNVRRLLLDMSNPLYPTVKSRFSSHLSSSMHRPIRR